MTREEKIALLEKESPESLMMYYDASYVTPSLCEPGDQKLFREIIIKRMKGESK